MNLYHLFVTSCFDKKTNTIKSFHHLSLFHPGYTLIMTPEEELKMVKSPFHDMVKKGRMFFDRQALKHEDDALKENLKNVRDCMVMQVAILEVELEDLRKKGTDNGVIMNIERIRGDIEHQINEADKVIKQFKKSKDGMGIDEAIKEANKFYVQFEKQAKDHFGATKGSPIYYILNNGFTDFVAAKNEKYDKKAGLLGNVNTFLKKHSLSVTAISSLLKDLYVKKENIPKFVNLSVIAVQGKKQFEEASKIREGHRKSYESTYSATSKKT